MVKLVSKIVLTMAASGASLHIDRAHLQLKLQALETQTHCITEHATLNGDVYPKRLCLRQTYEKNGEVEDSYESNPEYAQRVWIKNPNERYNDCFCNSEEGYIELASNGQCIKADDCALEFTENCPENEEYGLYISDEPYCKGYLDIGQIRQDPDIFDDIMDKIFGASDVQMNWVDMFTPTQFNSMFDDACNEPDSPIKEYCNWRFASSGLVNVWNSISSTQQNAVRRLVLKTSYRFSPSSLDNMKLQRGCHCRQGYGRAKDSSLKYFVDQNDNTNFCYNQCIPETDCGKEIVCE